MRGTPRRTYGRDSLSETGRRGDIQGRGARLIPANCARSSGGDHDISNDYVGMKSKYLPRASSAAPRKPVERQGQDDVPTGEK